MITKASFVNIIGAPNVGKSTLINNIIGQKISIVTPKAQTTRNLIKAIHNIDNTQIIFTDSPGIFDKPKTELEKKILHNALSNLKDHDSTLFLMAADKGLRESEKYIIETLKKENIKIIGVINKIDKIKKDILPKIAEELWNYGIFEDIFMISALKNNGIKDILKSLSKKAPESPWYYGSDYVTTASSRFIASEIIREKLFLRLNQELPYNLAVIVEKWEEMSDGSAKIYATIFTSQTSHKNMIIGKKAELLKTIGREARIELSENFNKKIHLFLFVKVRENWLKNPEINSTINDSTF